MCNPRNVLLVVLSFTFTMLHAQYKVEPRQGYTPQIGLMVYMLEDLKGRITEQVKDLDQSQTDFLFDANANSIGALVMHLVSTEAYYYFETLEGRQWTADERMRLGLAGELNTETREKLKGYPIQHYLDLWDEVREKTLAGLKTKDDAWFASSLEEGINYHYIWYHVMEHAANHMGQIALVKNRLPE